MLFDAILKEIGEFGPWQIILYVLLGLVGIPTGFQNMSITFLGGDMDHWCHVPELANLSEDLQRYISIPNKDGKPHAYSHCYMYDLNYSGYNTKEFLRWNRSDHVDVNTPTKKCNSWQYDQSMFTSTYVSAMDLVCDRAWMVSLIQTIYMTGFLSGCIGFGQLSDRIGRKKTLVISLACEAVFATAGIFASNYVLCVVFRFLVGAAAAGAFTTMFVFCMEIIGPTYRVSTGIMVQLWFALGLMILPLAAYFIRDHVHLQWIMAMTPVLMVLYAFFIPESPRWLVSQGRDDEARDILRRTAKFNKRQLPYLLELHDNRAVKVDDSTSSPSLLSLLRTPNLRKITLAMWWAWFVTSLVYYGLALGVSLIGGNVFVNSFLSGAIEIPSYVLVIPIMNRVGRRWTAIGSLVAAGLCCFVCIALFDRPGLYTVLVVFSMCGKFFIAATFAVIYVYSAELFPTVVRQVGVGSSSMCARMGGLIQPQFGRLTLYWGPIPFLLYGITAVTASLSTLILPETLNETLPDTLEDGEDFGRKPSRKEADAIAMKKTDFDNNTRL